MDVEERKRTMYSAVYFTEAHDALVSAMHENYDPSNDWVIDASLALSHIRMIKQKLDEMQKEYDSACKQVAGEILRDWAKAMGEDRVEDDFGMGGDWWK